MKPTEGLEPYWIPNREFKTCETTLLSIDEIVATYLLRSSSWDIVGGKSVILDIVSWNFYTIANATD